MTERLSSMTADTADAFRHLVESVVEYAVITLDRSGRVTSWNRGAERLFQFRATEMLGQTLERSYPPTDPAVGNPALVLQQAGASDEHVRQVARVRRDGSRFLAHVTVTRLNDSSGEPAGFVEITRELSQQPPDQPPVPASDQHLVNTIIASLPGVYYLYDETGQFLRWNHHLEQVSEYSSEEIRCLHPLDLFEGRDRELIADKIQEVFRSGCAEVEADLVSKSGRRTHYYFNGVLAEVEGRRCLLGMGIDLTSRRRSEEALRIVDQRLRLATSAANIGLWDWDLTRNEVYFSPEWKAQLGYQDDEIGSSFQEWESRVHPDDLAVAKLRIQAYLADPRRNFTNDFRLRHRDGTYRHILSQGAIVLNNQGAPIRMLGSHIDVTEQRRAEDLRYQAQKMEAIGQLAAGVAHDFNNLLTVINGYADLLHSRLAREDPSQNFLAEIRRAGVRAATLTRQLLTFSRRQVVHPAILNLNHVVAETGKMLQRLIPADIFISTSLAPDLGSIKADYGQIEQVLINLFVNARDAMPEGGRITVETRNVALDHAYCRNYPDLQPGRYILLAVSDTGCGIDEKVKARIFEPFFSTKPVGQGTGLGLATVHGIVKQAEGHIAVYSEPGQGATFKVYLPLVAELPVPINPVHRESLPQGTETILLAEDDPSVRPMARHLLEICGYRVLEAVDGQDALRVAQAHPETIHLLVTDVVMPNLGGRELAERLVALRPECRVLFVSGYADDAIIRHGVLSAEVAFLQKPFIPSHLAHKVRTVLDARPS